jgi:glutamate racemase
MENTYPTKNLVGIFDSGVGGLSVLREIHALLPSQPLLYIGDQAHVPYGKRQPSEIRTFAFTITHHLLDAGAGLIVVACNTASAAALKRTAPAAPRNPFVGMEPAVKPASQLTHNKIVGVLATPATFQGDLYNTLVEKFAQDVTILTDTLPGLVEEIENGHLNTPKTAPSSRMRSGPWSRRAPTPWCWAVLHFPFVLRSSRKSPDRRCGSSIPRRLLPAARSLCCRNMAGKAQRRTARIIFSTTGDELQFKSVLQNLLGVDAVPQKLSWCEEDQKFKLRKGSLNA